MDVLVGLNALGSVWGLIRAVLICFGNAVVHVAFAVFGLYPQSDTLQFNYVDFVRWHSIRFTSIDACDWGLIFPEPSMSGLGGWVC